MPETLAKKGIGPETIASTSLTTPGHHLGSQALLCIQEGFGKWV